jgi:hypothetical protein
MSLLNTVKEAGAVGPEFNVTPSLPTLLGHLDEVAHPRPRLTSDVVGVQVPVGCYGHVTAPLTPLEELTRHLVSWHNQLVEARREWGAASSAQRRITELEKQVADFRETLHRTAAAAGQVAQERDTAVNELQNIRAAAKLAATAAAKKSAAKRRTK